MTCFLPLGKQFHGPFGGCHWGKDGASEAPKAGPGSQDPLLGGEIMGGRVGSDQLRQASFWGPPQFGESGAPHPVLPAKGHSIKGPVWQPWMLQPMPI